MRALRWVSMLLLLGVMPAWAATYAVGIGDDCPIGVIGCFSPTPLTISVGDSVRFYDYADTLFTGLHNVVADDGSFRCANGCDDDGGNGAPVSDSYCMNGYCVHCCEWSAVRTFNIPGVVSYHDEVSGARGVIIVQSVGGSAPGFAIGAGITGAWYDPAQSGHGLFIEVLPNNRFLAAWFAYNPAGSAQAWFTGVGTYGGNTATITAVEQPTGGRWIPNFDPNQVVHNAWGTLTFNFTDCNHGKVDFNSVAGYGSGSMNLTRLTQPAGLSCP
jgi:plastocyanin